MRSTSKTLYITLFLLLMVSIDTIAFAAPKAELWPRWQENNPQSTTRVDHSAWAQFLEKYLVVGTAGATNLVRYAKVNPEDKASLAKYIKTLSAVPMSELNRAEQKAVWINLYNSLTVHTILEHYPVKSIRKISSGWLSSGPWGLKLVEVEETKLSLNDIEHRILRPIWQDNRVHYTVNCASLGCPNLQAEPFTAENIERLLDKAAHDYVNSPRGVDISSDNLILSSIYDWFQEDFGGTDATMLAHLEKFAAPGLAAKLKRYQGAISYQYSWDLNEK
jgi:hypothetical protein